MTYAAKIIADSFHKTRLTTFVVTFPRFEIASLNTYRQFSRNSASSRAIPTERLIDMVMTNPYIPAEWGRNKAGMQADEVLSPDVSDWCERSWLEARDAAVKTAKYLHSVGVHKQNANRCLEPWMWTTVIITSTTFKNFFKQRCHKDAQPEIRKIAEMMRDCYLEQEPRVLKKGEWHLPFIDQAEREVSDREEHEADDSWALVSAARCARVSYTKHESKKDFDDDLKLAKHLSNSGHWSPFEHQAKAASVDFPWLTGNFGPGWIQFRKTFEGESGQ